VQHVSSVKYLVKIIIDVDMSRSLWCDSLIQFTYLVSHSNGAESFLRS
jgi:hypothetical protein